MNKSTLLNALKKAKPVLIHEYFGIDYEILRQSNIGSLPFNFEFLKRIKF